MAADKGSFNCKEFHIDMYALRNLHQDPTIRKNALKAARKNQQDALKAVLTQTQWKAYEREEKGRREAFLARAKEKKIGVTELD